MSNHSLQPLCLVLSDSEQVPGTPDFLRADSTGNKVVVGFAKQTVN